jgi:hypothetical protein
MPQNYGVIQQDDHNNTIKVYSSTLYMYFCMITIIAIQSVSLTYIIKLTNVAKGLDILDVNTTEVHIYKNKIESIINFLCNIEDICSA